MRRSLTAVAVFMLAEVVVGVAWATIPDGAGTIHACYSASDKTLRVIDSGGCAKGETPVSWNQNAIQGPQGPQGNQGPQGDTGPQGLAGLTLGSTVSADVSNDSMIGGFSKTLTCPAGQKALNGGWFWDVLFGGSKMDQPVVQSEPIGDDSWTFAAAADSTYAGEPITVSLTCVYAN